MYRLAGVVWLALLWGGALLGGCLWNGDDADPEPDAYDAASVRGAFVFGGKNEVPAFAVGGRMDLSVDLGYASSTPFEATTEGAITATRTSAQRVTLRSEREASDELTIYDPDFDRVYGRFPLRASALETVRLLPPTDDQDLERRLNPAPARALAVLAGSPSIRLMLALTSSGGRRLLDHDLAVRAPDGVSLQRNPFWDVLELQGIVATTPPISLQVTAGARPWTVELPVVASVERLEVAPLTRPFALNQVGVVCFEALSQELAVQGVSWTFSAQNLTLFSTSPTPGCIRVTAVAPGTASVTATVLGTGLSATVVVVP